MQVFNIEINSFGIMILDGKGLIKKQISIAQD